jgi:hypothetical protein
LLFNAYLYEKATLAATRLNAMVEKRNIVLKLNKKTVKSSRRIFDLQLSDFTFFSGCATSVNGTLIFVKGHNKKWKNY